jgi:tRNA-dihydrouridine synthase
VASALLQRIEAYLNRSGMRSTMFGRAVGRDPMLVAQLRGGRIAGPRVQARINAFLDRAERELGEPPCSRP